MALSDTSIKNPVLAWMIMLGVIVFGLVAFLRLGVSRLPDVDFPVLSVSANWEGAAPEVVETEITDNIEDSIMGIEGVEEVISTSRQGRSDITVQFSLSKNIDVALQEIQSRISRAQRLLPQDMDPPVISKSNPEDQPIIWVSLSGDRPLKFLMEYTRDYLKDQFTTVPGVGEVTMGGYVEPNLRVWMDADKMRRNELTVDDVIAAIQSEHAEVPAGYIDTGKSEMNIRVVGEAGSTEEFSSIIIPARKGSPLWKKITIGDVAQIEDGLANVRRISRAVGIPAVGLGIRKQRGTNAVEVARAVKERIREVEKYLPQGLQLKIRFDTTEYVEESIREIEFVMLLSVALTAFVCWIFLGSFSSAFNIFLAIPISICGTFFVLYLFGFTLNTFTLLGLSLVIGIIVDDAIMMLENITRHNEEGESRVKAALQGSREITFAAIVATISILAIFIPVIFMKGVIGKYFLQFGVTISVAVMVSLLGALTITPMYCSQYLKTGHTSRIEKFIEAIISRLRMAYAFLLERSLNHRWKIVFLSALLFAASLFLFKKLKKEFVPPQDLSRLSVRIETKTGSSIEFTDEVFRQVEEAVTQYPEVESYFSNIGGDLANSGSIMLTLKHPEDRPRDEKTKKPLTQQELMPVLRLGLKRIPGIEKVVVQDLSLMGFTARRGFPVEFTLNGSDWDKLVLLSDQIMTEMEKTGLMVDIDIDYKVGAPEVRVVPDRRKAAERGVSISTIGNTINALIGGVRVGKYTRGGRRYDIRVQLVSADRKNVQNIKKIWVRNNRGEVTPLAEVVSVVQKPSMLSITRKNRERAIRVTANVAAGKGQGEAVRTVGEIGKKVLPEGYKLVLSGSAQTFRESFGSLYIALILGIFVAYMFLGAQFNSFIHPFTVLIALPFSISGAVFAMFVAGQTLNIYSAIGVILLMGLVQKNSILLIEFTNQLREKGMGVTEALKKACPLRMRPILMTAFTTIAAAVPPALALGPGAETSIPMAVVVIGGMFLSTFLTFFVVPSVYSLMSGLERRKHQEDVIQVLKEIDRH